MAIVEVPTEPEADGEVFSVITPAGMADESGGSDIHLQAGGRVVVQVGRFYPEVEAAIDRDDPVATGEALAHLGFQVDWWLIEDPDSRSRGVDLPPAGSVVLGLGEPGFDLDPSVNSATIEIASPEVAEAIGH